MKNRRAGPRAALAGAGLLLLAAVAPAGCRRSRGGGFEGHAFVAVSGDSTLAAVDLASFSVVRQIRLGSRPAQIVSDAASRLLYVLGEGGPAGLTVVDAASLVIRRSLWLADRPQRIRLSPQADQLYILDAGARLFKSLNLETLAPGWQARLPAAPVDFDVSSDGAWACVSLASGEAAVIDLRARKLAGVVPAGAGAGGVAIRSDGRQAFVASRADRSLSVIEMGSLRRIARLPLNTRPEALRFKPDGGELFVSGGDGGVVLIVSAYRAEVDQPMLAGAEPRDMAISRNNLLFVANSAGNTVSVIGIDDRRTLASVPTGEEPHRVALTPDDRFALVLNRKSGDLAVIRTQALLLGRERVRPLFTLVRVGSRPVDLVIQPK